MERMPKTMSLQQVNASRAGSMNQPLLQEHQQPPRQQIGCWKRLKNYVLDETQPQSRVIRLNGEVEPPSNQGNLVKNTKYNLVTFIPVVLFNQFKFFLNLFFLLTALTQLVPFLKVGLIFTYLGPLALVLTLTMAKEAVDDFKRYRRDLEANNKKYKVLRSSGWVDTQSKDLVIGDIVEVKGKDRIPADMVLLYSQDDQGTVFLKTDQLDGQTDWKLRKAVKITQTFVKNSSDATVLLNGKFRCSVTPASDQIYNFDAIFEEETQFDSTGKKQRLSLQNTLWTSTVLANGCVIGLVIFTGKQTRISMGTSTPKTKVGILDWQINTLSKILFSVLFMMTAIEVLLLGPSWKYVPIEAIRMLILLSSIIPISLRVNMDFSKLVYSAKINNDRDIQGTIARNSNIPEELGRIKYLLTDKTGTLTQNQMLFKRLSIEDQYKFTCQDHEQLASLVQQFTNNELVDGRTIRKRKEISVKEIITCLALCHNVTPLMEDGVRTYQASSPDQITLVKLAQSMGIIILERTQNSMKLENALKEVQEYEIVYNFPFSSERKRMGIILQNLKTKQYVFYLKGADTIMRQFITDLQKKSFIDEECRDLAMQGLRTLVICQKVLSAQWFAEWRKNYQEGNTKLEGGKEIMQKCISQLQSGVEFLGITGVQDKLQQDIKATLENLRNAEIRIWMLTGDKVQTAECISISSGMQSLNAKTFKIESAQSVIILKNKLSALKTDLSRVLIIDGKSLSMALDNQEDVRKDFYMTAMKLPTVLCCRCSPAQKAQVVEGIRKYNKSEGDRVAAIGDGGNDVGMIQAADIGLGICGKEGKQAALAADYSMQKFRYINKLLLWHGRLSYKRSALLAQFVIHRGLIISVMQFIFSCIFYFVSIPIFNSYLALGYATIFTFWPVFSLIFDEDIDRRSALAYPRLYASLQKGKQLTALTFMAWAWKAFYQGSVILILCILLFPNSYIQLETICFSVLILTQYCMSLSQLNSIHIISIISVVGSLVMYALSIIFLKNVLDVANLSLKDLLWICLIVLASWGPIFAQKLIRKRISPTDYEKVMKNARKSRRIRTNILRESFG